MNNKLNPHELNYISSFATGHTSFCLQIISAWPELDEREKREYAQGFLKALEENLVGTIKKRLSKHDSPQLRGQLVWEAFRNAMSNIYPSKVKLSTSGDLKTAKALESRVEEILSYIANEAGETIKIEIPYEDDHLAGYYWGEHGAHFPYYLKTMDYPPVLKDMKKKD